LVRIDANAGGIAVGLELAASVLLREVVTVEGKARLRDGVSSPTGEAAPEEPFQVPLAPGIRRPFRLEIDFPRGGRDGKVLLELEFLNSPSPSPEASPGDEDDLRGVGR